MWAPLKLSGRPIRCQPPNNDYSRFVFRTEENCPEDEAPSSALEAFGKSMTTIDQLNARSPGHLTSCRAGFTGTPIDSLSLWLRSFFKPLTA